MKTMRNPSSVLLLLAMAAPQLQAATGYFDECLALYRMVEDPEFIHKVARENGLNSIRFYATETPEQVRMILAYGKARNLCGNGAASFNGTVENTAAGKRKP